MQADRQIVVTSDKYPQQLQKMPERLVSRFTSGLVADVQVPQLETRVAIVRKKAALEGMKFEVFNGGEGFMRREDHQFFQPMYIVSLGERSAKEPFEEEHTGWGWRTVARLAQPRAESLRPEDWRVLPES